MEVETEAELNLFEITQVGSDSARDWDQVQGPKSPRLDTPALLPLRALGIAEIKISPASGKQTTLMTCAR